MTLSRNIILGLFLTTALSMGAVVATPDPVVRVMPDGSTQTVRLHGDEFSHWITDLQGNELPLTRVTDTAIQSYRRAWAPHRAPQATMLESYVPSKGTVHIPVILVNFTDLKFTLTNPKAQFSDLFNGSGGSNPRATGSVHTYYNESSFRQLNLVYDVYGPYDLSNTMSYYGQNSGSSSGKNVSKLIVEAAKLARDVGKVNFASYDNDNDGYIDNLSVVVAGYNEAEGGPADAIWPHYSSVYTTERFSSKSLHSYLIISEYRGSGGSVQAGIGTYCHEFGHALGLPDLYDTENNSHYTVGYWDLMCAGCYNNSGSTPPSLSAYERFAMGWLIPEQLKQTNSYILPPLETSNQAYIVAATTHNLQALSPSPNEYFLLENRQAVGWDAGRGALVGTGLMVSHITFNAQAWQYNTVNNNAILGYGIVSAGVKNPQASTANDLFPGPMKVTSWLPTLNDETTLKNQIVVSIAQLADSSITFHYGAQTNEGFFFTPDQLPVLTTTFDKKVYQYEEAKVEVQVRHITSDTLCIRSSSDLFDIRIDTSSVWLCNQQAYIAPVRDDSVYTIPVYVRFTPIRTGCSSKTGSLSCFTTDNRYINQLPLSGVAPRPTYITQPVTLPATQLSSTSFSANWEAQPDAELYYATLYLLKDSASTYQQDFTNFTSVTNIALEGWEANFAHKLHYLSETGASILFSQTGQYLRSAQWGAVPESLRFWVSNNYTVNGDPELGGVFYIDAAPADTQWITIDSVHVQTTTKGLVKTYAIPRDKNIAFFRFRYRHIGGDGGAVLDGVRISSSRTLQYIRKDLQLDATTTECIFNHLTPSTDYYFSVRAYEYKGCTPHYTPMSELQTIRTLDPVGKNPPIRVTRLSDGTYIATLPESGNGSSSIYVYDVKGQLLQIIPVPYGILQVVLPTHTWAPGNNYILKLIDRDRLERSTARGKVWYRL